VKKIFAEQVFFWWCMAAYLVVGASALWLIPKGQEVIWLNSRHSSAADFFFSNLTHLGDGLFCVLAAVLLLWSRFWKALMMLLVFALSGGLSQFFKKIIFPDMLRPSAFFEGRWTFHAADGVELARWYSFPSGHSTTAFAAFAVLALCFPRRPWWGLFCFLGAFIAALSRIYLAQHFLMDTYAGAILGTFSAVVVYAVFERYRLADHPLLNRQIPIS
jgi:membrane-associated phospholipid phosphatase